MSALEMEIHKIAELASQIKNLANNLEQRSNANLSGSSAEPNKHLLISDLIDDFKIKPRENRQLLTKSEFHFLTYLNKRIFKLKSSANNNFTYNHFNIHCQVALNALFDWDYPQDPDLKSIFYNRLVSRRLDFVFTEEVSGKIACVIEIDGASHNNSYASKIDGDKATILNFVKIPVLHIKIGLIYALEKYENYNYSQCFNSWLLKLFNSFDNDNSLIIGQEIQSNIESLYKKLCTEVKK